MRLVPGRTFAEPQEKGGMFQTLQKYSEPGIYSFLQMGRKIYSLPFNHFPQALPKFVYSNETELGPKCNQRHLVHPKSQF